MITFCSGRLDYFCVFLITTWNFCCFYFLADLHLFKVFLMTCLSQNWLVGCTLYGSLVYWVEIVRPHFAQWEKVPCLISDVSHGKRMDISDGLCIWYQVSTVKPLDNLWKALSYHYCVEEENFSSTLLGLFHEWGLNLTDRRVNRREGIQIY